MFLSSKKKGNDRAYEKRGSGYVVLNGLRRMFPRAHDAEDSDDEGDIKGKGKSRDSDDINDCDKTGEIRFNPSYFSQEEADAMEGSISTLPFVRHRNKIYGSDKYAPEPRSTVVFGDVDGSNYTIGKRTHQVNYWDETLLGLREEICDKFSFYPNVAVVYRLDSGDDNVSFHSDDEVSNGGDADMSTVFLLFFGADREFQIRPKPMDHSSNTPASNTWKLSGGTLLLMIPPFQGMYENRINRENPCETKEPSYVIYFKFAPSVGCKQNKVTKAMEFNIKCKEKASKLFHEHFDYLFRHNNEQEERKSGGKAVELAKKELARKKEEEEKNKKRHSGSVLDRYNGLSNALKKKRTEQRRAFEESLIGLSSPPPSQDSGASASSSCSSSGDGGEGGGGEVSNPIDSFLLSLKFPELTSLVDLYPRRRIRNRVEICLPDDFVGGSPSFNLLRAGPSGIRFGGSNACAATGWGSYGKSRKDFWRNSMELLQWYREGCPESEDDPFHKKKRELSDEKTQWNLLVGTNMEEHIRRVFEKSVPGCVVTRGNYWTPIEKHYSRFFGVTPDGQVRFHRRVFNHQNETVVVMDRTITPSFVDSVIGHEVDTVGWFEACRHETDIISFPLECKTAVREAYDYVLLDHACQVYYQMWMMNVTIGFYINCHWSDLTKDYFKQPPPPNRYICLMFRLDQAFLDWMLRNLDYMVDCICKEKEPDAERNIDDPPPDIEVMDMRTGLNMCLNWRISERRDDVILAYLDKIDDSSMDGFFD